MFSLIIQKQNRVLIAVDRMRTFPLFYHSTGDFVIISDDPYLFLKEQDLNCENTNEFLLTEFTTGRQTFLKGVFQTRASEAIVFENKRIATIL